MVEGRNIAAIRATGTSINMIPATSDLKMAAGLGSIGSMATPIRNMASAMATNLALTFDRCENPSEK